MIGTGNKIFKTAKKEYQRKYFLHIAAMKYYVKVKLSTIINVIYFCGSTPSPLERVGVRFLKQPIQLRINFIDNHSQIFRIIHKIDAVHIDNE